MEAGMKMVPRVGRGRRRSQHATFIILTPRLTPLHSSQVWYDLIDSLPFQHEGNKQGGARIRCKDAETLATCIRWYSSAKLTSSDIDFVDRNEWDENMCDFDPRVFQSFVWAEK